jgi:citrate synthase
MSDDAVYARGLRNVAACRTRISFVDPLGALYYSGYDIDRLIGRVSYEEVVHLLLYNRLPNNSELGEIKSILFSEMKIPKQIVTRLRHVPKNSHPMENIRSAISQLGEYDSNQEDHSDAANKRRALKIIAQLPTIVATLYRVKNKLDLVTPKKEYGFAENFLYMFRGKPADVEENTAIDRFMILHADHGLNASTFAARVTASTFSDMYSAVTSAIGTLRGKLHGGASERVMGMLVNVDNLGEVEAYIRGMLFDGKKIMGFGHRIYQAEDPRSRHLRKVGKTLCQRIDRMDLYRKCSKIQDVVHRERKIYPNVDFYAAIVLNALGVPKRFFTPFFASSRIAGWTAHILEQYSEAVLIRPTSGYLGAYGTKFVSIEKR